jgi:hypothetical protein
MRTGLILGFVIAISIPGVYADSITVNSSAAVTFLNSGLASTDFPSHFTAANFLAAQTGPSAALLSSTPFYVASLSSAPAAEWIGVNANTGTATGDTALYAISFDIPDPFSSGSLTLFYAVDNELGGTNAGIYLNGVALPDSTGIGSFTSQNTYTSANIGADLVQGTNWLYIDAVNLGAEAGLIFSADISTVNSIGAVPEPASVLLFAAALIAVGAVSWRRRNRDGLAYPNFPLPLR